jgi:hypothetical protein
VFRWNIVSKYEGYSYILLLCLLYGIVLMLLLAAIWYTASLTTHDVIVCVRRAVHDGFVILFLVRPYFFLKLSEALFQRKKCGKFVPLRHADTKGKSKYTSSFFTWALDGGAWSASRLGRTFSPKERTTSTRNGQQAEWASEVVWIQRLEDKPFAPVGDRTPVVWSVVSHCTD